MDLFLIRHMQTPDNAAGVLQGRRDVSILPPGPEEVKQIRGNLGQLPPLDRFDHILVSRLKRTSQTAALYTDRYTPEPLLDELDFGPFEGRPRQELILAHPQWETDPSGLVLGESMKTLGARVTAFLKKYGHAETVLVFGHGAWIRALLAIHHTGSLATMNRGPLAHNTLVRTTFERRKP